MRRKIETRGSVALGAAVALAAAGLLAVDGVLLAFGVAAGAWVGLVAVWSRWNLRKLVVSIEGPRVVRVGEEFRMRVRVSNRRSWMDAIGLELMIDGPGGMGAACRVPWVVAGSEADGDLRVRIAARGHRRVLKCRIGSSFPWGLLSASVDHPLAHEMLVLPKPVVPIELLNGGADQESEGRIEVVRAESMGTPRGLRDFRAGDRARDIAWPASVRSTTRGGGLMVREWDPPGMRPRKVTVLFHSYGWDGALIRPDRFERAVSLAWGAAGHLLAAGIDVVWVADFEAWVPREVRSRRKLGELGELLAGCRREGGTERHELEARLDDYRGEIWVFSDMAVESWQAVADEKGGLRVVDVTRFERGRKLNLGGAGHA